MGSQRSPTRYCSFHDCGARQPPLGASSNQYTSTADTLRGFVKPHSTHSFVPRWSHQVKRGMLWSLELFGSRPSIMASTVSLAKQCEAWTGGALATVHSFGFLPVPMTGNKLMRSRAAPIGMRMTFWVGSSLFTGLSWSLPTRPSESIFQLGIFLALARRVIGAVSGVNGFAAGGTTSFTTLKDFAGSRSFNTRP